MSNFEISPERREAAKRLAEKYKALGFASVKVFDGSQDEDQREASFIQHLIQTTALQEGEISNANN